MADEDDPYNPYEWDPFAATATEAVEALARDLDFAQNTAIPGVIEDYDPATQKARVAPVVQQKLKGRDVPYPPIPNVPVCFPQGGGFSFTWPLQRGDFVMLVFSMRSIANWKLRGGKQVKAKYFRRFHLSDAVAIPGLRPFSDPLPDLDQAEKQQMAIRRVAEGEPDVEVGVTTSGKVVLGERDTVAPLLGPAEVVAILDALVTALPTPTVLDAITKADLQARLARIKS